MGKLHSHVFIAMTSSFLKMKLLFFPKIVLIVRIYYMYLGVDFLLKILRVYTTLQFIA